MEYDFDQVTDRKGTDCVKWDRMKRIYPENPDALPFWVADMDFVCPRPITDAVQKRAGHLIYGYTEECENAGELVAGWMRRRHGWNIRPEWVAYHNGVIPILTAMMLALTEPGDQVVIQPPVYYPFAETIAGNGRVAAENPLLFDGSRWVMDYEGLEKLAENPAVKMLFLCNPHNPVSRAYTEEELRRLGKICLRHRIWIVSDEIHSDLVYPGNRHVPIASLSRELAEITVTASSFSKTFNTAGLQMAMAIIPSEKLRNAYRKEMERTSFYVNLFGSVALKAAYENPECEGYLSQLLVYLWDNYQYVDTYLRTYMPKIRCQRPEATYLLWLDCCQLQMSPQELESFFLKRAGIAFDFGPVFGTGGEGYVRLNIACPRRLLQQCLERMRAACEQAGL